MVAFFGDGIALAEASGATPAEALWNVSRPDGDTAPYPGDFTVIPGRLVRLADDLEAAAVARVCEENAKRS
jgi:hypothetical protein